MSSFWPALPMGVVIATISSIVGIGGGILWMPVLLLMLKLSPETAVLTSLIIQSVGMGSGTWTYYRNQRIDLKLASLMLLVTIPGVIAGAGLTRHISLSNIELILGLMAMTTAFLFVSLNHKYDDAGRKHAKIHQAKPYLMLLSIMSVISGFLSVSIGEWLIPIMHGKMNLRMSSAIATSITTIFGVCLMGSVVHFFFGSRPHWQTIAWAAPGVLIGGQIGPRIAEKINERMLKEIFIFLLTLIGIHLIYNAF